MATAATIDMADEVNPPLTYEPVDLDIPASKIYGTLKPNHDGLENKNLYELASKWIDAFNAIVKEIQNDPSEKNLDKLNSVIASHASWKDHLALSWDYRQFHGLDNIKDVAKNSFPSFKLKNFEIDTTADHRFDKAVGLQTIHKADDTNSIPIQWVQIIVKFENEFGYGNGLIRLISVDEKDAPGGLKAFTIYTALENIKGNEETLGRSRPQGANHGQNQGKISWLEKREKDFEWGSEKTPTVLIVGGGQGGLNVAARLKTMSIDCLIIEKNSKIGDNWRNRYKFLVLHDPVWYDHLAYIKFPDVWPVFTPKDKLGDWFEAYSKSMELSYWVNKTVSGADFDPVTGVWSVNIIDNDTGKLTNIKTKHIVMATGHSGEPNIPTFKDQDKFKGTIVHSSQHSTGKSFQGENAVVVGCCNSGHDIAQDFYEQGAKPILVQRSTTCVINSEIGLKVTTKGLYEEGGPKTETADLILQSMPVKLLNLVMQQQYRQTMILEKDLHESLKKSGFKADSGYGGTGLFGKYYRRGGGYYIDVGCSKLIADDKIKVQQGKNIERFTENGLVFSDGTKIDNLAIVVLATGYSNIRDTARRIFGDKVADKVNPVWGLDDEGEINTMWRDSGHPKFWYMGGNLAVSRYFSKRLALKIIAQERGFDKSNS